MLFQIIFKFVRESNLILSLPKTTTIKTKLRIIKTMRNEKIIVHVYKQFVKQYNKIKIEILSYIPRTVNFSLIYSNRLDL